MGFTSVLRGFGAMTIGLGLAMLVPFCLALINQETQSGAYLFGAIITLLTGAGSLGASGLGRVQSDFRSALLIVLIWWAVMPGFAAIPFVADGQSFGDAYFEAVSALTTTGAWISKEAAVSTVSGMIWRAQLQWFGGLGHDCRCGRHLYSSPLLSALIRYCRHLLGGITIPC